jgi:hypothetical protein
MFNDDIDGMENELDKVESNYVKTIYADEHEIIKEVAIP